MSASVLAAAVYCERASGQFWAEPLNALTSLGFVLAALLIAARLMRAAAPYADVWLLAVLAAAVGVGSFLWHSVAAPWAQLVDVVSIGLFVSVFLLSYLRRVAGWRWSAALSVLALYQALNLGAFVFLPAGLLNGSVYYLPVWLGLSLMCVHCWRSGHSATGYVVVMWALFSLALLLRSIDTAACPLLPWGTHFAWHLLNVVVLWLAMRLLLD